MAVLLIVGNTSHKTFVNAILAAHVHARDEDPKGLERVFVLNSSGSEVKFGADPDWRKQLRAVPGYELNSEIFTNVTVELDANEVKDQPFDPDRQLDLIARHVQSFLSNVDREDLVYVDLTNGTSHYKAVLANIAFIIGTPRPYVVNKWALPKEVADGYWELPELRKGYVGLPAPARLDLVAPVWLTEIRRFQDKAVAASESFRRISGSPDDGQHLAFREAIVHAIDALFKGEEASQRKHSAQYIASLDGAIRYLGNAFETLVNVAHQRLKLPGGNRKALNVRLSELREHLAKIDAGHDAMVFRETTDLLRELRNAATHASQSRAIALLRARLATELLFLVTELFDTLSANGSLSPLPTGEVDAPATYRLEGTPGQCLIFGLDGDDTGRMLEQMFQDDRPTGDFEAFSKRIDTAMKAVSKEAKNPPLNARILFCSGDDLLFEGNYDSSALEALRDLYARMTEGQTCSVGFGRTPKEAYVALKMAKAKPNKDSIAGVTIVTPGD